MDLEAFKRRLNGCDVLFSEHALLRAKQRQLDLEEVERNLKSPKRLIMVFPEPEEGKYTCWFEYSKTTGHRYTIHINAKTSVITVIKIKPRWQREVEKHATKIPNRLRL